MSLSPFALKASRVLLSRNIGVVRVKCGVNCCGVEHEVLTSRLCCNFARTGHAVDIVWITTKGAIPVVLYNLTCHQSKLVSRAVGRSVSYFYGGDSKVCMISVYQRRGSIFASGQLLFSPDRGPVLPSEPLTVYSLAPPSSPKSCCC